MAGQILGDHYEVERELGKQEGRWTLLARDLNTQEQVVIKLLCVDETLRSDDLKLFEREAETLKALTHPCVPQYLGYFEHRLPIGKALALVQTYVPGRSLEACLKIGRTFTEAEAKQIAKSLLYILIYLHGRKPPTIHRDIKPSNIVLADRRTHLVNFGSVKMLLSQEGNAFTAVSTHEYTPPEQFGGRVLTVSDLYSLGVTLIAIITGRSPKHLPRKGTKLDFEQVVDLSPAFSNWLSWMTEANLDRRLKSAKEALQSLEAGG
ncbi:serine/threonine protein kinase [Phormidesmis sp. 146-35]